MESKFRYANNVFWQNIRKLRNHKEWTIYVVKIRIDKHLNDDFEILSQWKEHFEEQYNPISGSEVSPNEEFIEDSNSDLSAEELFEPIKTIKDGKAVGIDEIETEMLNSMGEKVFNGYCISVGRTGEQVIHIRNGKRGL